MISLLDFRFPSLLLGTLTAMGAELPAPTAALPPEEIQLDEQPVDPFALAASLLRIAERKLEVDLPEDARTALYSLLEQRPGPELEVPALLLLADSYRQTRQGARAAAILERALEDYPNSPDVPRILLSTGRIYRSLGADKLALARFFAVLNATLKIDAARLEEYQLLARTAQFEIAETHLTSGRFADASEYFRRLSLLDLAPEDRARALFKTAHSEFLNENFRLAAQRLQEFLKLEAGIPEEAEARFLLAVSLERLGQHDESLAAALSLFDSELIPKHTEGNWRYWQRRTGNYLANESFRSGRLSAALSLYSQLAELSPDPDWRAPALYQVGLSAERLGHVRRARDAYDEVVTIAEQNPHLGDIASMAEWRRSHLEWGSQFEAQHRRLIGTPADPIAPSPVLSGPVTPPDSAPVAPAS